MPHTVSRLRDVVEKNSMTSLPGASGMITDAGRLAARPIVRVANRRNRARPATALVKAPPRLQQAA
jgi:hypothetical protein